LFVVDITYTVPQEEVAAHRQEHVKWLEDAFTKGSFVMAGPKATKDGGILLSTCLDKDSLEAELNGDPYRVHGVATHKVVEFEATMTA
jgi:uncharacterized protein YciI